jgi:hypothetical protein
MPRPSFAMPFVDQPDMPIATQPSGELPASVPLYIYHRDVRLAYDYQLRDSARFVLVDRERIRFHVGRAAYDQSDADTKGWTVWLEDDSGRQLLPESREGGKINRISVSWKLYPWRPGGDAWCREPPCYLRLEPEQVFQIFEGQADYVFHDKSIIGPDRRELSLVMRRGRDELRYTWRFGAGTEVRHHGRSKVDEEVGTIAVPGPQTEVAGTEYEDER